MPDTNVRVVGVFVFTKQFALNHLILFVTHVARAQAANPDGDTLLLADIGSIAISPSVYLTLPFDPAKEEHVFKYRR